MATTGGCRGRRGPTPGCRMTGAGKPGPGPGAAVEPGRSAGPDPQVVRLGLGAQLLLAGAPGTAGPRAPLPLTPGGSGRGAQRVGGRLGQAARAVRVLARGLEHVLVAAEAAGRVIGALGEAVRVDEGGAVAVLQVLLAVVADRGNRCWLGHRAPPHPQPYHRVGAKCGRRARQLTRSCGARVSAPRPGPVPR